MSKALSRDHIIIADVEKSQEGLELGNVYQIVSAFHGSYDNDTSDKEIKLRDPYHSNYPTESFNHWNQTTSTFSVTPSHFLKLFSTFSVTLYSDDWKITRSKRLNFDMQTSDLQKQTVHLNNPVSQEVAFILDGFTDRSRPEGCGSDDDSTSSIHGGTNLNQKT